MKLDALIFAAHPDDAEIGMGGTIAKYSAQGMRIGICDLTLAEMSSNGNPTLRQAEASQASQLLGTAYRCNLQLPDRGLRPTAEQLEKMVRVLRECQPRIVFVPHWQDRHPDHVMCSQMADEALFSSKLRRYLPEVPTWEVTQVYYYCINDVQRADLAVDVSAWHAQKMSALAAYRSQFVHIEEESQTVPTILNDGYLERVVARDLLFGQQVRVRYAEGFCRKTPLLLERWFD